MKTRFSLFLVLAASIVLLSACGGGSSTAVTPTPATIAPVAATPSNQLASSVSVSGYSALSIASKTSSSVQTAGIKGVFQNLLARLISPAYAATCATDAYKLVGVNSWNQTASYQVINGVYYSLDTNWVYDVNTGSGSQVTALTKKDMGFATETPLPDVVYTISSDTSWGGSKQIFVSKDYLYVKAPSAPGSWTGNSNPGDSLDRYDPTRFDKTRSVGQQLGTALSILANSNNISVQSVASTATDNILKVVGRKTDDPDLVKVYGTVDDAGLLTWAAQKSTTYSPVTIVKL